MKNSTKYVWIVLGAIAVVLIVLTIMVRSIVAEHIVVTDDGGSFNFNSDSGPKVTEEYRLEDFNEIKVAGGWDILVIADDQFSVTVETRENAVNEIVVEKRGDTLYLGLKYPEKMGQNNFHGASATVYMPELTAIDVDGAININIDNFVSNNIDFRLDGAGQLIGENCEIENLLIEINGAVNVDLTESSAQNAEVYIDGAGNIQIQMAGGSLTGVLSGLANLEYSGSVSRLDVKEDGISNVKHKK